MSLAPIFLMYGAFAVVGWLAARKVKGGTAADLLVAGRQMPVWLAVLTMTATWVDGGYLLGTAEGVFASSVQLGVQGGVCFGISLILGGLFFARRMRHFGFTTLIDPFEARFGKPWAAVLFLPALAAELFWCAELLVAIGATFAVVIGMDVVAAILLAAVVTTAYTVLGGMWSVAYTDAVQLGLVALGLLVALPYALAGAGGLDHAWAQYVAARPAQSGVVPSFGAAGGVWTAPAIVSWFDVSLMLILGGIPWNCYLQRVLSCKTPGKAQAHSLLAGLLTIAFVIPPLLMGIAAFSYPWTPDAAARLETNPAETLPLLFARAVPPAIGLLGLAAIVGAVTSSFSSSILSAASMLSWNGMKRLVWPSLSMRDMKRVIRVSIVLFGGIATAFALKVQSVQALWFFTSDLVFVLLFPQLVYALFDRRVNRIGSIAAFSLSCVLRMGAGEPLLDIPRLIPYPALLPVKVFAAATGVLVLPAVSRLTARWDPPRPLRNAATDVDFAATRPTTQYEPVV